MLFFKKKLINPNFSISISTFKNQIDDIMPSGWALKENQKYGKKGGGKRISKSVVVILQSLFLSGNADKSHRCSAKDMLKVLNEKAQEGHR